MSGEAYFALLILHKPVRLAHACPPSLKVPVVPEPGALMAAAALDTRAAAAVLGLRTLNPYVAAALGDWRKRACLGAAVPRQYAPAPAAERPPAAAGASSFGMGGTNAHLLAGAAPGALSAGTQQPVLWQRSRRAATIEDACVQKVSCMRAICSTSMSACPKDWLLCCLFPG